MKNEELGMMKLGQSAILNSSFLILHLKKT